MVLRGRGKGERKMKIIETTERFNKSAGELVDKRGFFRIEEDNLVNEIEFDILKTYEDKGSLNKVIKELKEDYEVIEILKSIRNKYLVLIKYK